jgi:hypothetical protein
MTVGLLLAMILETLGEDPDRPVVQEDLDQLDDVLKAATPDLTAH